MGNGYNICQGIVIGCRYQNML